MTKRFFLIAAVALLFTACAKDEVDVVTPIQKQGYGQLTIGASFENNATKSDIDDNGNFTWSTEDGIKVYSNTHYWSVLDIVENESAQELGPKFEYANFTSYAFQGDYISTAAVFPKTIIPAYNDPTLSLTIPSVIGWNDTSLEGLTVRTMQADNIMVARGFVDGANTLDFKNVGGLFRLTLNNVPTGASKLEFITNKKINGTFAVGTVLENDIEYPVINTSDSYEEGENIVTINFTTLTEPTKMVYFIPVPVGTYQIGFAVKDGNDTVLWEFHSTANNSVARAHVIKMPTLSHITVGGGGEGATNIIVTPTAYSGTVNLPSTQNNIYVKMNETDGTINLEYSSAANAQHPENVYLQALGDITALNINLPDSHVELTGTDANNVQVVTNVSASTTINTFVVDNKVQIGKTEDNQTVGGLTINGGSLDLSAPVVGPVTVVYDVVSETVNQTTEKVSININSAIKKLVVTSASTQSAPDKIYVTLGATSTVTDSLKVPETNCNLYVAPGASVTTVTTSASENTIAGEVATLNAQPKQGASEPTTVNVTVTGEVAELDATGAGTTVFITEDATVTTSIVASSGATVNVDPEAIEGQNVGTSEVNDGKINAESKIVAVIGSTPYSSLALAYAAAVDGDTITLLADCVLVTSFVNEKNITIDLGDYSISGNVGAGTAAQSAEGKLIYNKGTLTINSANNKGRVWNSCIDAQGRDAIYNAEGATIIINGGIFGDSDTDMTNGNNVNRGAGIRNFGTATLNGGKFTAGDNYLNSGWAYAIINGDEHETCVLTINDGVVVYGQNNGNIAGNAGTININGGEFNITGPKSHYNVYAYNAVVNVIGGTYTKTNGASGSKYMFCVEVNNDNASNPGQINVTGGNFTQNNTTTTLASSAANIAISGGTFNVDPSNFVAAGYTAVHMGEQWTVQSRGYIARIDDELYQTLADAFAAVPASGTTTITMIGDTDVVFEGSTFVTIAAEQDVILNLNGHKINIAPTEGWNQASQAILNNGKITFVDNTGMGYISFGATPAWVYQDNYNYSNSYASNLISNRNNGIVYVQSGTLKNVANGSACYVIDSYNSAKVYINGGSCVATKTVFRQFCGTANNVLQINGGVVEGGRFGIAIHTTANTSSKFEMTGGTVNAQYGMSVWCNYTNPAEPELTISGGEMKAVIYVDGHFPADGISITGGHIHSFFSEDADCRPITGGVFDNDPSHATDPDNEIQGVHNHVAEGYEAVANGDGTWTVSEVNYVAQIGSTKYETLAAAVAAVPDNGQNPTTITMIANETTASGVQIVIPKNKNIVLDLNGKTISGTGGNASTSFYYLNNNGTLEIKDSSTGGKITSSCPSPDGSYHKEYATVYNANVFTLTSGTIENTTNGGATYAVTNSSNAWGEGDDKHTTFYMNGGTLTAPHGDQTLRVYQNCKDSNNPDSHNTVVIDGGVILDNGIFVDTYLYQPNPSVTGNSVNTSITIKSGEIHGLIDMKLRHSYNTTLSITGGTFVDARFRIRKYTSEWGAGVAEPTTPVFNISNGTFTFENANTAFVSTGWTSYPKPYSITGGTFNVDPSAYVAVGYAATQSGNVWTVGPVSGVAAIGNTGYPSLEEAITAANNSDSPSTITMLQDVTLNTGNVGIEKEITLNLNGKTITNNAPTSRLFRVYNGVDFTIDGTVSGSSMVIPESNKSSYGFVNIDATSAGSTLTVNGGSYSGAMLNGVFFKNLGTSQTVTLNGVTCVVENGDGQKYGNMTDTDINGIGGVFEAKYSAILNVNGGVFTSYSREKGDKPMGIFNASNATVTLEGATIISESAAGIEMAKGEITGSCISYPSGQQIHTWANTAIELSAGSNTPVVINSGEYRGEYGINVLTSGTNAIINGGTFEGHTSALHVHGRDYDRQFEITINAGTFIGSGSGENSVAIETMANDRTHIVINGGTFTGQLHPAATEHLSITGGTFDHDPSAYVAEGHIAVYSATTHKYTVEAAQFWEDVAVSDSEFASITDENNKIITISTAEQLAKLAKNVNAHVPGTTGFIYKGYTVNLANDIDLAGKIWTPIGVCKDWTRGHFTGTFDGQGHTISNLKVVREDRAGLFGSIYGEAVIKDLNVTNVTLIANHFAAGIVGWINEENYDLVVDNCSVTGGVITVVPNFVNNEWDNGDKCGGVVGYSNQNTANHCKITNNRAENLTITAYRDCGGIVGFCSGNVLVSGNTANNVTLVQDNFRGYKSSVTTVQQIVGRNDGSTQENNTATGVVINTVN